jgi:hypothetical protein
MKMTTGYTSARSLSFGMNITFCRRGYSYAGTLVNNTCISGDIESMNVYYKHFIEEIKDLPAIKNTHRLVGVKYFYC